MAEQSYLFDFSRVDTFIENMNVGFFIDEMYHVLRYDVETQSYEYEEDEEIDDAFQLVIVEYGADNIEDYLDSDGYLIVDDDDPLVHIEDCSLDYFNRGNGSSTIELHGNVSFDIGDDVNIPIKAIFLRSKSTNYVMGYSINNNPFTVTNEVVFDDDVIFWDISRFNQ